MRSALLMAMAAFLLSGSATARNVQTDETVGSTGRGPVAAQTNRAREGGALLSGLPLAFVENRGQWEPPARFVARRGAMIARLERGGIVLDLRQKVTSESIRGLVLRLSFEGAADGVRLEGEGRQRAERNYFLGADPEGWVTGVPAYSQVLYRGLHEGIDLRVRDHEGRLEYDALLAPGADLTRLVFRVEGSDGLVVESGGTLRMETEGGPVFQSAPRTWYELPSGEREEVECRFVALGEQRYGFELAERRPGLPVVIDPGLEWCTYLGGSDDDQLFAIDTEPVDGHVIVGGRTYSVDFPNSPGAYQASFQGGTEDGVISCLDPGAVGANQLVWSTYLGGTMRRDRVMDLQVGDTGKVYLAGQTLSGDFPTTPGAFSTLKGGGWAAFVARLNATGSALEYSTFLGGFNGDWGAALVHLGGETVGVVGTTDSSDFPTTPGCLQPSKAGMRDLFVSVLELAGNGTNDLQYSTYLGGSSIDGPALDNDYVGNMVVTEIARGTGGDLVVAGYTYSVDFPTTSNAYNGASNGGWDGFIARIDPAGNGLGDLLYSTYIGGSSGDGIASLLVEPDDVIVVGGWTYSSGFPTTVGAYDTVFFGPANRNDAYVLWLDTTQPPAQQLQYSTFFSGDGWEAALAMVADGAGGVIVGGFTGETTLSSTVFPVTCGAWQPEFKGYQDCFLLHLTPAGSGAGDLLYSTLFGGWGHDSIEDLVLVSTGGSPMVHAVGLTDLSDDLPTTPDALQSDHAGGPEEAFVLSMELEAAPFIYCSTAPNSVGPGALIGSQGTLSVTANDFTLTVSGATPDQFGFFYYGKGQIELPFGDGFRCVSGDGFGIHRLNPAKKTDATGYLQRLVDFTQPPAGSGAGQIDPGTSWNFQFWYRDPGGPGGSDFNLSDALRASFCP